MRIEYVFSFLEFKAIGRARLRRRKFNTLRNFVFWGVVIFNFLLSSWLRYLSVVIVVFYFVILPFLIRRSYKLQMLDETKIQINIADDGIESVTDKVTAQYKWSGLIGASEEPEHFVIWVNNAQAFCIPKHAFKHKKQLDDFKKIIAKNIENHELLI